MSRNCGFVAVIVNCTDCGFVSLVSDCTYSSGSGQVDRRRDPGSIMGFRQKLRCDIDRPRNIQPSHSFVRPCAAMQIGLHTHTTCIARPAHLALTQLHPHTATHTLSHTTTTKRHAYAANSNALNHLPKTHCPTNAAADV
eukprot:2626499-Rhodomonas_salina.3